MTEHTQPTLQPMVLYMILYTENPKDATIKLLALIDEFGKVAGYKINIQKSIVFLYTNKELSEREIKETIPLLPLNQKAKIPRNRPTCKGKRPVL